MLGLHTEYVVYIANDLIEKLVALISLHFAGCGRLELQYHSSTYTQCVTAEQKDLCD